MNDLLDLFREYKARGADKETFLKAAARIPGVYVPSLYTVDYNGDGTVKSILRMARAGKGDQTDYFRFGQGVLSEKICSAIYRGGA